MENIVILKGITKIFPQVTANDNIDFELRKGEIHSIVGENGAGKSTLMKILTGLYRPSKGEIFVKGRKVKFHSCFDSIKLGIGIVHQHFMLIDNLTVIENLMLGIEGGFFIDERRIRKKAEEISEKYNLKIPFDKKIEEISTGDKQRVEILKVLLRDCDILIFDEPTQVLTPIEVVEFFKILRRLKEDGSSIIFITHKLKEVMEISDRCTVLRDGKKIGTLNRDELDERLIARMMVGRDIEEVKNPGGKIEEEVILEVKDLRFVEDDIEILKGISFCVKKGEILGICGVEGNGQRELVEIIAGLRKATSGRIFYRGRDITDFPVKGILSYSISHIPEDRLRRGLVLNFPLKENFLLTYQHFYPFKRWYGIDYKFLQDETKNAIDEFDVRGGDVDTPAGNLSGGNQQKFVVARELCRSPYLLIAHNPTRGVDIGSIE
ncbi:MAG: ABC transporter ATP-binding protein, partial [Caldiserica bacterium]